MRLTPIPVLIALGCAVRIAHAQQKTAGMGVNLIHNPSPSNRLGSTYFANITAKGRASNTTRTDAILPSFSLYHSATNDVPTGFVFRS